MTEMVRDERSREPVETVDDDGPRHRAQPARKNFTAARRSTTLVAVPSVEADQHPSVMGDVVADDLQRAHDREIYLAELTRSVADLELRVRELVQIEKMRDLELHRLEEEVEAKNSRVLALETELFHARRRGDDLDRRWNELAATYERTAASLVESGALIESIHAQVGYRAILSIARIARRRPALYAAMRRSGTWLLSKFRGAERVGAVERSTL